MSPVALEASGSPFPAGLGLGAPYAMHPMGLYGDGGVIGLGAPPQLGALLPFAPFFSPHAAAPGSQVMQNAYVPSAAVGAEAIRRTFEKVEAKRAAQAAAAVAAEVAVLVGAGAAPDIISAISGSLRKASSASSTMSVTSPAAAVGSARTVLHARRKRLDSSASAASAASAASLVAAAAAVDASAAAEVAADAALDVFAPGPALLAEEGRVGSGGGGRRKRARTMD